MDIDQLLQQIANQVYEFDASGLVQQYIFELSAHFKENHMALVDIKQFVTFFVNQSSEEGVDGIILITKLIELYQEMMAHANQKVLKLKHITDYLISSSERCSDLFNAKFLPQSFKPFQNQRILSDAEISPPEILGLNPSMLKRLQTQLHIENIHSNSQVIQAVKGDGEIFLILQFCESITLVTEFSFKKILQPSNLVDGNFVLYGFYSQKQQRLGAVLRNNTLVFWDRRDNYAYDFQIETQLELLRITYLEMQDLWITSSDKGLQLWNLEQGKHTVLQNSVFGGGITVMMEALHLQMFLVGSQPNIVSCWDMFEQKFLFKFTVAHQILTQMICSSQFQLLFTIGFNNYISCYELHAQYNDYNLKCQLKGHGSSVQCIEHVEQTALLVSIDNKNIIILWDIRSQQQTQVINLTTKILAKQLFLYNNRMCVITNILSTLQFEKQLYPKKSVKLLQVIYDQWNQRNIIVTKADIRIQNIVTGKTQYVLSDFKNEISAACLIEHGNSVMIGTIEGDVLKVSLKHGHVLQEWDQFFQDEIINISYDESSQLLHIMSVFATLKCLSLTPLNVRKDEIVAKDKRALRQILVNTSITLCSLSPIYGMLAVSFEDFIQIWNLEYYCVSIQIQLEDNAVATSMTFCDKLPLLIIGTNQADIFIFQLAYKSEKLVCTLEAHLNIVKAVLIQKLKHVYSDRSTIMNNLFSKTSQELIELYDEGDEQIEVKHLFNNKYKLMTFGSFASRLLIHYCENQLKIFAATNRGSALVFDMSHILDKKSIIRKEETINQKPNYNPYRVIYNTLQGNFVDNYQIVQNRLIKDVVKKRESKFEQSNKIKQKFRNSLIRFSILKGLKDNPELDITHSLTDSIFSFDEQLETAEQIHNDTIIQLSFLYIDPYEILFQKKTQLILSGCIDDTIKVFTSEFVQVCQFSIHNPIPTQWSSLLNEKNKLKAQVLFSLDLLQEIMPSLSEGKKKAYDIDDILRQNAVKYMSARVHSNPDIIKKEPEKNFARLKDSFLNKKKLSLCNMVRMPALSPKLPPSLRYYDEKIKQGKYQSEMHEQDLINEHNVLKRQQGLQMELQRQQKKDILDYLTPETSVSKYQDISVQALTARLKTESRTHQSKITKTTNDTKRTFTRQSLDFFDYAQQKEVLVSRSKISSTRFQTRREHQDFHKIITELHGKLKTSKRQT